MELTEALQVGRDAFWMALITSAPILGIGLLVGLTLSMVQAVTQLQEQSLTFVPKILAMVVAGALLIPWIANQLLAYTQTMLSEVPW
jgi:flagellar biosynthetic protein FliQ